MLQLKNTESGSLKADEIKQNGSTEGSSKFKVRKHDMLGRKWSQH